MSSLFARFVLLLAVVAFVAPSRAEAGLIISFVDLGGSAPATTGTGTLTSIMQAAGAVWELAFNSAGFTHTLTLTYEWVAISGSTLAQHGLSTQGGSPNREISGFIEFDNDGTSSFFMDGSLDTTSLATLITSSSEYTGGMTTASNDFGGGSLNERRSFSGGTGDASGQIDAFSVAMHEIGHALGLSSANTSYQDESWPDNDIDVGAAMPFTGSVIPTNNTLVPTVDTSTSNAHIPRTHNLMHPSFSSGIRRLPSAVDILANAQLSQFTDPNLDLDAASVPEPGSLLLASMSGGMGLLVSLRRRRSRVNSTAV